ncbi:hypothetical protein [Providencia sp. PROV197]|uniref:hypothetical protein n=1 Tax=Providencia sp. PROV197 TaxID=2949898 RepID=UPI00234BBBCB|nr:hypothetical protein [Providencia sp. PROV197]
MKYYINTLIDEYAQYQVHRQDCSYLPKELNRLFLGDFKDSISAVEAAKAFSYSKANGCYWCCKDAYSLK